MKVLLVNPSQVNLYDKTPAAVPLSLLCVAGEMQRRGDQVMILDINAGDRLEAGLFDFNPDTVGITAGTAVIDEALELCCLAKGMSPGVKTLLGGSHVSALPGKEYPCVDEVFIGEYEVGVSNLDDLAFPPYDLLGDPSRYKLSRLLCRKSPVAYLETSRGCYGKCIFCEKAVQGRKMRFKSPGRVVDEMEMVLTLGYREIQFVDYVFAADVERSKQICEEILRRGLKVPWYPRSGTRVDKANLELFQLMKQAGCYRLPFGIESGSQKILDTIKKEITLAQIRRAVGLAHQVGLETEGFFIMGLPGETEADLEATVEFGRELNLDYAKPPQFAVPYPGTELTALMESHGQIKSRDWSKYHYFTNSRELYEHDMLSWDVLEYYRRKFVRRFNSRPRNLAKRAVNMLVSGKWKGLAARYVN